MAASEQADVLPNTDQKNEHLTVNVNNMTSEEAVLNALKQLDISEKQVTGDLDILLSQRVHLEGKLQKLEKIIPQFELVGTDSQELSRMLHFTSQLAQSISSRVRQLDTAKQRVLGCLQRVEDILDLKFCTDGVQTALHNEDYEQAAAHIHRFLGLDEGVLLKSAADNKEGSSLEDAFHKLRDAQRTLEAIVMKRFNEAVADGDLASVERFFKIFPLLNQHDVGLNKFSQYLCSQIRETSQQNLKSAQSVSSSDKRAPVVYAETAAMLLEGIARVVEIHQPLVETYYGPGRLSEMIEVLQNECDEQAIRLWESMRKHRSLEARCRQVECSLRISSSRQDSTVTRTDPRDLDVLLTELALVHSRTELYMRFIRRRVINDMEVGFPEEVERSGKIKAFEGRIKSTKLFRIMQELIIMYITMEEYYLKESVIKAIEVDSFESNSLTSSMLDDMFFVLKKCLRRSMSTCSIDGVCAMLNHACSALETEAYSLIADRVNKGYPTGSALDLQQAYNMLLQSTSGFQATSQGGKSGPGTVSSSVDLERGRSIFLMTLNNAEMCREYIETLVTNLNEELQQVFASTTEQEKAKIQSCLSNLNDAGIRYQTLTGNGVAQLCSTMVKPAIKLFGESFQATNHSLTEDDFTLYEANDGIRPVVQQLIVSLNGILHDFKKTLTPNNYDQLVSLMAVEITAHLERAIFKSTFNRLGGLQVDKELRYLIGYMTSVTTWSIRDRFARLSQIAAILNLETPGEIMEIWGPNSGSMTWRLTPSEVRQVLALRTDFRSEDMRRLKL